MVGVDRAADAQAVGTPAVQTASVEDLAAALREATRQKRPLTVGIDGLAGCGKTRLSHCIACAIPSHVVNLDSFLVRGQGVYVEALRYEHLKEAIGAVGAVHSLLVIEGACLLLVCQRFRIEVDKLVYVKRVAPPDFWLNEADATPSPGLQIRPNEAGSLDREITIYHGDYKPHEKADIVFLRIES